MGRPLERTSPESMGIPSHVIADMVHALEKSGVQMHGLMVSRCNRVLFETWWAPYGPQIVHSNQSLGKTYMGTALGRAYTEGLVRLEERVVDIFSKEIQENGITPDENMKKMTVRDLLCMGTGMTECPDLGGEDFVLDFLRHPVPYNPGEHFFYNTSGSSLLAAIVEKKTGRPLKEYMAEQVFEPIGLDSERMRWLRFKNGVYAEPGVLTTTEDNLRLAMLYLNGGVFGGKRILARDWVEMATTLQNPSSEDRGIADCQYGYGFMMWQCSVPGVYRFDGGLGQYCIVCPAQKLIVAIHETASYPCGVQKVLDIVYEYLCRKNWPSAVPENAAAQLELRAIAASRKLPIPALETSAWKEIEGTYRLAAGGVEPWPVMFKEFQNKELLAPLDRCRLKWEGDVLDMELGTGVHFRFGFDGDARISETLSTIPELNLTYGYAQKATATRLVLRCGWLQSCFYMDFILKRNKDGFSMICERPWMQDDGRKTVQRAAWVHEGAEV